MGDHQYAEHGQFSQPSGGYPQPYANQPFANSALGGDANGGAVFRSGGQVTVANEYGVEPIISANSHKVREELRQVPPGQWVRSPALPWTCARITGIVVTLAIILGAALGCIIGTWWPALARSGGVFPTGANDTNVAAEVFRRLAMLLALVLLVLCLWSYLACALLHPGPIHLRWRERFDGATPWCQRGCGMPKPPEAHHCRTCRTCVDRMDHHCPWIGQCVGRGNHKPFMLFLGYTAAAGVVLPLTGVDYLFYMVRAGLGSAPMPPGTPDVPTIIYIWAAIGAIVGPVFTLCLAPFFCMVLGRAMSGETQLQTMAQHRRHPQSSPLDAHDGPTTMMTEAASRPHSGRFHRNEVPLENEAEPNVRRSDTESGSPRANGAHSDHIGVPVRADDPRGACSKRLFHLRDESVGAAPKWHWWLPLPAPFPRDDPLGNAGLPSSVIDITSDDRDNSGLLPGNGTTGTLNREVVTPASAGIGARSEDL